MSNIAINNSNNNQFSLDLEIDDRKKSESDENMHITLISLNKIIKSIEDPCDMYIKSKYIKIVKHKAMISIV